MKRFLGTAGILLLLFAALIPRATAQGIVRSFANVATNLRFVPDNTYDIGASGANRPRSLYLAGSAVLGGNLQAGGIFPSSALISLASSTGVTPDGNTSPTLRTTASKITVDKTAFVCNALTCDATVATLPAHTFLQHALVDVTQAFACSATCTTATLSLTLGKTAGGTQYLLSFDADTPGAANPFGDAAAELGASLAPATTPSELGDLGSWSATTTVTLRLTSATGNIGNGSVTNLSAGSVAVYLTATVLQ